MTWSDEYSYLRNSVVVLRRRRTEQRTKYIPNFRNGFNEHRIIAATDLHRGTAVNPEYICNFCVV